MEQQCQHHPEYSSTPQLDSDILTKLETQHQQCRYTCFGRHYCLLAIRETQLDSIRRIIVMAAALDTGIDQGRGGPKGESG